MGNMIDIAIVKGGNKADAQSFLYRWIKDRDSYIKLNECILDQQNGAVVILFNHDSCLEGDGFSYFYSNETAGVVLSVYVYDSDYWGYTLYDAGKEVDSFCTRPDWLFSNASKEELQRYSGNSAVLARYFNVDEDSIKNYLVPWADDTDIELKAYPDDDYGQEDWQILDFMKKLGYEYPEEKESPPNDSIDSSRACVTEENRITPKSNTSKSAGFTLIGMAILFLLAMVFTKEIRLFVLIFGMSGGILLCIGGFLLYRAFHCGKRN